MSGKVISRNDALLADVDRYFTGRPCKHGHLSERYAESGYCIECAKAKSFVHCDGH